MCGGRDHPPAAPSGRAVFLRGVETGGRGRRVDGDPRGLVAGRAQDRHGAGRVRVGRGHEGVLTEEDGEVCARGGCGGVGCGDAAGAEGDGDAGGCRGLKGGNGAGGIAVPGGEGLVRKVVAHGEPAAFGPVRDRQDGRDGGVVRGVPVHGVGEPGGSLYPSG